MGREPAPEPVLPELRPSGAGPLTWTVARVAARPGVGYGVLLVAVALLAGRTGRAGLAAPLHVACGVLAAGLLGAAGVGSARALAAVAGHGIDGLSEERALRLAADVALAAVLVGLCLSLTADQVVNDLLTLPR